MMFDSTMTGLFMMAALVAVGVVLVLSAVIGLAAMARWAWRAAARRIARPYVAQERRKGRSAARREAALAADREKAVVNALSTVANGLVRTVLKTQLRHLALREDEHLRRALFWDANLADTPGDVFGHALQSSVVDANGVVSAPAAGQQRGIRRVGRAIDRVTT